MQEATIWKRHTPELVSCLPYRLVARSVSYCLPHPVAVYVFVGFWDGDYVSQLPYVWYYVGVKSSFQHARVEC